MLNFSTLDALHKLDPGSHLSFDLHKYQSVFLQVPSKGKPCPLYLAVSQDDVYQNGVLIYWSRKNKNAHEDDNEGRFAV
jgi:hypothetical protein